jgi:hypothetical protein
VSGKFDAAITALNIALWKMDKESFLVRPETYERERGQVVSAIALLEAAGKLAEETVRPKETCLNVPWEVWPYSLRANIRALLNALPDEVKK